MLRIFEDSIQISSVAISYSVTHVVGYVSCDYWWLLSRYSCDLFGKTNLESFLFLLLRTRVVAAAAATWCGLVLT